MKSCPPLLLPRATQKELGKTVEYLKAENRMLRSKLPRYSDLTPVERAKPPKLCVRRGAKIKEVISIVHPRTFARWLSESKSGTAAETGRDPATDPRHGQDHRRILGELKKLCIYTILRTTVKRLLQDNGFDPGPKRG
jgi:putative transposase